MLTKLSEDLSDLKRLTLWGCGHVTRLGLDAVIRQAEYLEEMSIDASPNSVRLVLTFVARIALFPVERRLTYRVYTISPPYHLFVHCTRYRSHSPHLISRPHTLIS